MGHHILQSLLHDTALDRLRPSQLGATFFVLFWLVTLVAFLGASRPCLRRSYLALFLVAMLIPGLSGKNYWLWPFQTWHLWGGRQARQSDYYELYAVDATGRRFVYDRHAIPPVLNTQVHYFARKLLEQPDDPQTRELTTFLLAHANARHLDLLLDKPVRRFPAFPPRQFGATWTARELAVSGRFNHVLARHMRYTYHEGGRRMVLSLVNERQFP